MKIGPMTSKKNNILIIALFLAAIILPLYFSDKTGGKISVMENRYLANFPTFITKEMELASGTRNGLENWINDNAGGRYEALLINKTISYKLFHVYPEENVFEGKDDWLYSIPVIEIPEFVNTNVPSQEHLNWLKENFSRIASDFKKRDIEYMVMLWPYKYIIYPEYFPNTLMKVNSESAMEILDKELSNNQNFDFKTALKTLTAGKQKQSVYYRAYDLHWNQYGAFLGYTELMTQAKKHLPELKILTEKDFIITQVIKETRKPWGFYSQEEDLQYILRRRIQAYADMEFFNSFGFVSHDPWKSYIHYKNSNKTLPKAVIIGDSFVWMFMLTNIAESFSDLVFINYYDMDNLDNIINTIKPDIIIGTGVGAYIADVYASYINTSPLIQNARIVSTSTPYQIEQGNKYDINITVLNTGTETWNEDKQIRLAIFQDGLDRYRIMLPNVVKVKPGEMYTFKLIDFQAPPEKSTYLEYQMVEEGVAYFGEKKRVDIFIT